MTEEQSRIGRSNVRRGKTQERRVVKLLMDWTGCTFRRRRIEGRDSTTIDRDSTADVVPIGRDTYFSIEVKNTQMSHLDGLLANPQNNSFTGHWHQACYDAHLLTNLHNKPYYPLLLFKPQPAFTWIAINTIALQILKSRDGKSINDFPHLTLTLYDHLGPISLNVSHTKKKANQKMVSLDLGKVILCRWTDFTSHIDPESIFRSNN